MNQMPNDTPSARKPAKEVTAAVIVRQGKVLLLLRRAPGQKCEGLWEFPGGKTEPGETSEACLERELREELTISGRTGAHVADSYYEYPGGAILLKAYIFGWTGGEMQLSVHDAVVWCAPADLLSYPLSPADIPIARAVAARIQG